MQVVLPRSTGTTQVAGVQSNRICGSVQFDFPYTDRGVTVLPNHNLRAG